MHGHLVAVKVRVVGGAHQGVQLQGAALHQHRLEGLDAQTVQGGRAVQEHGVVFDNHFQSVPHLGLGALHRLAGGLDVAHGAGLHQALLAEAALLALEHVAQRLQRPVVGAGDRAAAAPVVDQGVHRLLEHALLIADDDIRGAQLQQAL